MSKIQAGDTMLYVSKYGAKPQEIKVTRVTPSGQITLIGINGRFKDKYGAGHYRHVDQTERGEAWLFSKEKLGDLNQIAEECEQAEKERDKEEARRIQERDEQRDSELTTVKGLAKNDWRSWLRHKDQLGNHCLLWLKIPVRPNLTTRKGENEILIIRLSARKNEYNWETGISKDRVEMSFSFANKNTTSFSSCSSNLFDTDDEAIWEAIRYCYHNW